MQVEETGLPGLKVLTPQRFGDARGYFSESWSRQRMAALGLDLDFVQDNHSLSARPAPCGGCIFRHRPMRRTNWCAAGAGRCLMWRSISAGARPTYGHWVGVELSVENGKQLLVPEGFLHGFVTRAARDRDCL